MKQKILLLGLGLSVLVNLVVLYKLLSASDDNSGKKQDDVPSFTDYNKRKEYAQVTVSKLVCDNLYYPNSYDPVTTEVDSAFYSYITDADCVDAAVKLIDLRNSYKTAKANYEENDWTIRFHGNPQGAFLERERKERSESAKEMKRLSVEIEKLCSIIKNRDTSKDGQFIGWQVTHKYRASNSNGIVSFGKVLFVLDPQMQQCYFRFSLEDNDKNNYQTIRTVIENELGFTE